MIPRNGVSMSMSPGMEKTIPPKFQADLRTQAQKDAAFKNALATFLADVESNKIPAAKNWLGTVARIEELRGAIALVRVARTVGAHDRQRLIGMYFGRGSRYTAAVLEDLAKPAGKLGGAVSKLAAKANGVALLITMAEVGFHTSRGDAGPAFAELFKFGAGKLWPWGAVIEAVQSLADGLFPDRNQANNFVGVLRMLDPVGVGAIGVDSAVTLGQASVEALRFGIASNQVYDRISRITDRMNAGATGWLAQQGYRAGNMTKQEWLAVLRKSATNMPPRGLMP